MIALVDIVGAAMCRVRPVAIIFALAPLAWLAFLGTISIVWSAFQQ